MSQLTDGINIQQFGDGFDWPFNLVRLLDSNFLSNMKIVGWGIWMNAFLVRHGNEEDSWVVNEKWFLKSDDILVELPYYFIIIFALQDVVLYNTLGSSQNSNKIYSPFLCFI